MFDGIKSKWEMAKAAKSALTGGGNLEDLVELLQVFATPENAEKMATGISNFLATRENIEGCEVGYLIRRTPDGNSAYIDVLEFKDNASVRTIRRFTKSNLNELLNKVQNDPKKS